MLLVMDALSENDWYATSVGPVKGEVSINISLLQVLFIFLSDNAALAVTIYSQSADYFATPGCHWHDTTTTTTGDHDGNGSNR